MHSIVIEVVMAVTSSRGDACSKKNPYVPGCCSKMMLSLSDKRGLVAQEIIGPQGKKKVEVEGAQRPAPGGACLSDVISSSIAESRRPWYLERRRWLRRSNMNNSKHFNYVHNRMISHGFVCRPHAPVE